MKRMMNRIALFVVSVCCGCLLANANAQSTLFASTLDEPTIASRPIAGDAWVGAVFRTGDNPGGYLFDSVILSMGDAVGAPEGFTVSLYESFPSGTSDPITKIKDLNGDNPLEAGFYSYDGAGMVLTHDTRYALVVTSSDPSENGYYAWNITDRTKRQFHQDGWLLFGSYDTSEDGVSWHFTGRRPMSFAVHATAIPEPSTVALICIGGLLVLFRRRG